MAIETKNALVAVASVNNNGGASAFFFAKGFSAVAHTAAGVYTLTLDLNFDLALVDAIIALGCNSPAATGPFLSFTRPGATQIIVRSWSDAGVAQDNVPFDIAVYKTTP